MTQASRAGLYFLASGKIMPFESWSGAVVAVPLQEEPSGCVCKTILDKDNKA